ncbi:MAG TPA: sialidase family protein, partial [Chitinophagales bacterium]|nr:sialidase family protein [Chitinophagales bacterium]
MKRFALSWLASLALFPAFAQTLEWSVPAPVADAAFGFLRPQIALCNNVPVAVWSHAATKKIYASRLVGGVFSAPVEAAPNLLAYAVNWMSHEIASNGDTLFVTFSDQAMANIYVVRSLDGGLTFGDTVRVGPSDGSMPVVPDVAVMPDGNPAVIFIHSELDGSNARTVISRSTDGGLSFGPLEDLTALVEGEACDCCKGALVADGNRVALLFRNNHGNIRDIWAVVSHDGGATFTDTVRVDYSNWSVASCPSSAPAGLWLGDTLVSVFMN